MALNSKHLATTASVILSLLVPIFTMHATLAATDISSIGFDVDPATPITDDPDPLAPNRNILGYMDVPVADPFLLEGGPALDIGENNFEYPATRIGKFSFALDDIGSLVPNDFTATWLSITMAITDLDTNDGESDFLDIIFALSLSNADDGSTLLRILTNQDGGTAIAPQFITGFSDQSPSADPDIATNDYDLSGAPVLGSELAELYSASGGELWLYLIDTDDTGNQISLAKSLATSFSITTTFEPTVAVPIPPAIFMLGSAIIAMVSMSRRKT